MRREVQQWAEETSVVAEAKELAGQRLTKPHPSRSALFEDIEKELLETRKPVVPLAEGLSSDRHPL